MGECLPHGFAVACTEGRSQMRRIQAASRGRSLVRSPGPRLRAFIKGNCEGQVRHAGYPLHQRIGHTRLKMIGHALTAGNLVREDGRRALVLGAVHFAHPY